MVNNQLDQDDLAAPIDLDKCLKMFNGDSEVILGLLGDFLRLLDEQQRSIAEALAGYDPETFRREAHSIKGAAAVLSAWSVMEAAAVLEEIGKAGDLTGGAAACLQLEEEVRRLTSCYQSFRERKK